MTEYVESIPALSQRTSITSRPCRLPAHRSTWAAQEVAQAGELGNEANLKAPKKRPLYRKVNTTAHGVHHAKGGDYRDKRNSRSPKDDEVSRDSMHGRRKRGLDYTPLFKFLLSKRGQRWDDVYGEAVARLDRSEPIFWLVALREHERQRYVRVGESTLFSGMYVDELGTLQIVDPLIDASSLVPSCKCCTHTFNGVPFTRPFAGLGKPLEPEGENAAAQEAPLK